MSKTLVGKTRGCEKLQALDLSKMGSLSKGKEVEQLGDVVASVEQMVSTCESEGVA